jgi:DNA modification methylase
VSTRRFRNHLNDLDPKSWLKFQKSWFVHNPPPRRKNVIRHPAKFPETLVQEFIEFFTHREQVVFDPMVGTGSVLLAALRSRRHGYGIELNPVYAEIARQVVQEERNQLGEDASSITTLVITGDATRISEYVAEYHLPLIDYVITSPPYWNMLKQPGFETQRKRRDSDILDLTYSNNPNDLGNIEDYQQFLGRLVDIYSSIKPFLHPRAYLTIIVKNVKKGGTIYPLAWDLAHYLGKTYNLKDEKIWCQDNIRLAPYGLGNAWVSNTFHHYCLQFRNE